jgi:hypothetical protein
MNEIKEAEVDELMKKVLPKKFFTDLEQQKLAEHKARIEYQKKWKKENRDKCLQYRKKGYQKKKYYYPMYLKTAEFQKFCKWIDNISQEVSKYNKNLSNDDTMYYTGYNRALIDIVKVLGVDKLTREEIRKYEKEHNVKRLRGAERHRENGAFKVRQDNEEI